MEIVDRFCKSYLEDTKNIPEFLNVMKDLIGGEFEKYFNQS
jgi:hypothetical protein